MRIAWAIPCAWAQAHAAGLYNLIGAQIDSVVVQAVPIDVPFDVVIRLVGTVPDFHERHEVEVILSDPDFVVLGSLRLPVDPREPGEGHIAGYELNHHVAARIVLPADVLGGYDLSFLLDGEPEHRHKATIAVTKK